MNTGASQGVIQTLTEAENIRQSDINSKQVQPIEGQQKNAIQEDNKLFESEHEAESHHEPDVKHSLILETLEQQTNCDSSSCVEINVSQSKEQKKISGNIPLETSFNYSPEETSVTSDAKRSVGKLRVINNNNCAKEFFNNFPSPDTQHKLG